MIVTISVYRDQAGYFFLIDHLEPGQSYRWTGSAELVFRVSAEFPTWEEFDFDALLESARQEARRRGIEKVTHLL